MSGCSSAKYNVDYCGQKEAYIGAKDSYASGRRVKLYYNVIGTDTDYSFYLDGERLNVSFSSNKGYIIKFTMPERNVKLECRATNGMFINETDEGEEADTEDDG